MIRVTVELIPLGIGEPEILGRAEIKNNGTGTRLRGNYTATFWRKARGPWRTVELKGFHRRSEGAWHLLMYCLGSALLFDDVERGA